MPEGTATRTRRKASATPTTPPAPDFADPVEGVPFPRKRWALGGPSVEGARPPAVDPADVAALADALKVSPVVARLLLHRGLADPADARAFLRPTPKQLHDPAHVPGLTAAANRIAVAIKANEKVVVYGDYDVDGVTGTAILWHALRLLGGHAEAYLPHRVDEGYGLNDAAVAALIDAGAKLIVTVDCGITATGPVALARSRGVDVVVTDHHEWGEVGSGKSEVGSEARPDGSSSLPTSDFPLPTSTTTPTLPDALVVHPRLPPAGGASPYPNPHLCGAGVAYKLAWGVGLAVSGTDRVPEALRSFLIEASALAALGTVADVVPLVGENRALAHFGLGGLKKSTLSGVRALIASAGLGGREIDSFDVGFKLGPRLNAAGRMGHAREALRLLTDATPEEAASIAADLEQANRSRQSTERKIADEAAGRAVDEGQVGGDGRAVVVAGEGWHPGVVGIVAARLVERFGRPAVVIGLNDGRGQGSGRSIPGFHLSDALGECAGTYERGGGHAMAAGLTLSAEQVPGFRDAFRAAAARRLGPRDLLPLLTAEVECDLADVGEGLVAQLARLGPFGAGNPKPLLLVRNVELMGDPRCVGKNGDVLQLLVRSGRAQTKCVMFGCSDAADCLKQLRRGATLDLVAEPSVNEWNGRRSVELMVKDLRVVDEAT